MQTNGNRQTAGFTLIEMIGVLAVIAILAALLLPKVANAINDSKINSTVGSYQTVQTAVDSAYGKYLSLNSLMGTNQALPMNTYDTTVLIPEGYLDHPFSAKVGTGSCVECVTNSSCNAGLGYYLAGASNGTPTTATMQIVVECCVSNVTAADAYAVSSSVDGTTMTPASIGLWDTAGKICWNPANQVLYMFVEGR